MKLSKTHKLYYRAKDGSIRRLDKLSLKIYLYVLDMFINKGLTKKYQEKNKKVTHWSNYQSIDLHLPKDLNEEFDKCSKNKQFEISYNGTWKPLATIIKAIK